MWFSSGIVMHFVPFPAFTEAERFAGLAPIKLATVKHGLAEALALRGVEDFARIRLIQRKDGPVYLILGSTRTAAFHATNLRKPRCNRNGWRWRSPQTTQPTGIGMPRQPTF